MSFKDRPIGMITVLTVTAVIVAGALAGFYGLVHSRIEANRLAEERRAIFAVLKGAERYETIEREVEGLKKPLRIFKGLDADGNTVGYAFVAVGPGFSALIKIMVGLDPDKKHLTGMKVVEQIETPGLGTKITEEKFEGQFRGLAIEPEIEYVKNRPPDKENQIQAITGATISSRAVVEAINRDIKVVLRVLEEEG